MQYIHEVYYLKSKKPFATIITKKAFKQAIIAYYFNTKKPKELAFKLKDSPNKSNYLIIPCINRLGNKSLYYVRIRDESIS